MASNDFVTITKEHAEIISSFFYSAGWEDDADELLGEIFDNEGVHSAIKHAELMLDLANRINAVLDKSQQVGQGIVKELEYMRSELPNQ